MEISMPMSGSIITECLTFYNVNSGSTEISMHMSG